MQITPVNRYHNEFRAFNSDQRKTTKLIQDIKSIRYPELFDTEKNFAISNLQFDINRIVSEFERKQTEI